MQAIILAAGMGKRLGELTKNNTKCMIKVNNITLIERLLKQLDKIKLNRIIIVAGYKSDSLIEYIEKLKIKTSIEFIHNSVYQKTNNIYSLYLAKEKLLDDDTLLFESDLIVEDAVVSKILNNPYPDLALVAKFESWMDGTVVTIDKNNNILKFVANKNFKFEEIPDYYKTVNIYKFSKSFSKNMYVPFLKAYCAALGKNEYYEQVLRVITLLDKPEIKALPLENENWYEIDDIQDLDIAESIFAEKNEIYEKITKRFGGYWRYPGILDFCYLVNPFFPNGRLVAEIKANFERLLCEYPSGLGVNNLLAAKDFDIRQEYICVGNGAAELIKSTTSILEENYGIIRPIFEEYPNRINKIKIVEMISQNKDFSYSAEEIKQFFESKNIQNLVLVNPDNPSGNYINSHNVTDLCNWCLDRKINFILDESFVDFSDEGISFLQNKILEKYPNLIVIKSISKSYGVPGLRLGILATSNTKLLDLICKDIAIWNINSFAEFYLQIYGKYESDYKQACCDFKEERKRFYESLNKISFLRIIPSQANYFLCEVTKKYTSAELAQILLSKFGILVKDCSMKTFGKNFIRIAIRNTHDNNILIQALNTIK